MTYLYNYIYEYRTRGKVLNLEYKIFAVEECKRGEIRR